MSEAIKLSAKLDLSSVAHLVTELKAAKGDINLDASGVTNIGALGLQALVSAARSAKAGGHQFALNNAPDRMIEQMKVMGLTPEQLAEGAQ